MTSTEQRDIQLAKAVRDRLHPHVDGAMTAAVLELRMAPSARRVEEVRVHHPAAWERFGAGVVAAAARRGPGCKWCVARVLGGGESPDYDSRALKILLGQENCGLCRRSRKAELAARGRAALAHCEASLVASAASRKRLEDARRYWRTAETARENARAASRLGVSASAVRAAGMDISGVEFLAARRRARR